MSEGAALPVHGLGELRVVVTQREHTANAVSVLIIEDDDVIGRHLEAGLRGNGYAVNWTRTGVSALAEARGLSARTRLPARSPRFRAAGGGEQPERLSGAAGR
ncbi:hypothetical protein ABZS86_12930 [Streptomyces sp. NPDC005355]|uniref:hypothetical protein n=1 Tax=Streptomyces sp. NPDC005355 TaxID=3157038 RepID=UPI0033A96E61